MSEITTGRSVLVTGGNRGIGLAIARAFEANGDQVAITYRSGEVPEGLLGVKADVTDTASIDEAFTEVEAAHGPVEVLVANAGVTRDMLLLRMNEDDFSSVIDTNLTGAFRVIKRASKGMIKKRKGRVVLISSVVGLYGSPGQINYAASKAGVVGMTLPMARELARFGIRVNTVAPGIFHTPMVDGMPEEVQQSLGASIPFPSRLGRSQEFADLVGYILGNRYINGETIRLDGAVRLAPR